MALGISSLLRLVNSLAARAREILAARALGSPYRFLVRDWSRVGDLDLAVRVLGTEFFARELHPVPLAVQKPRTLLVLAPHQDDEVIGAGGTLTLASRAGANVHVLFLTDGEQRHHPYASSPEESRRIRAEEARAACDRLGAEMHELGISNREPRPTPADLDRLGGFVRDLAPDVLLAPWLLDGPAKHRMVNHLLWLMARRDGAPDCEVWGYQAHNSLYPNAYVDITDVADEKRSLLRLYRSQVEHGQCYDHLVMGLDAWNSHILPDSPERRYVELFFTLPFHELERLVGDAYFRDLRRTYRDHRPVLEGMAALHSEVTGNRPA